MKGVSTVRATAWFCLLATLLDAPQLVAAADLAWERSEGYRRAPVSIPRTGKVGFVSLNPSATGILFTNLLAQQRHLTNQILLNGSGVAAGDVDGDGWPDLYFCGLDGPNRLYRNLGGFKFQNITTQAGIAFSNLDCTGAAFADTDGDRDLDLIVNTVGSGTHLFLNTGRGQFTPSGLSLNANLGGTSLALADVDGDGYLDLYVANYRTTALMDMPNTHFWLKVVRGRQVVEKVNGRYATEPDLTNRFRVNAAGGIEELGEADSFFSNRGGTNFVSRSFTDGSFLDEDGQPYGQSPLDWGLAVMFRDINGDGLPDIYVCNDFDSVDRIWLNTGRGHFRAAPRLALRKTSFFSMGIDFADINRDGWDDFFVLDMLSRDRPQRVNTAGNRKAAAPTIGQIDNRPEYIMNTLFLNRGDGTYAEIAQLSGLAASEWSWTPAFLDVDLDGWEDVLITNGNEREARNIDVAEQLKALRTGKNMSVAEIHNSRRLFPRYDTPNLAFRNLRNLQFEERGEQWGFDFKGVSHGMAFADLDNDGDLDVIVNNLNAAASILRNDADAPRVCVRLKGNGPNTQGIGAKITVFGGPVTQSQEMMCGGRYLSSDDTMRVFAAGSVTNSLRIEVVWRSGKRSVIEEAKPNHVYQIDEARAEPFQRQAPAKPEPYFEDASELLRHVHYEEPFDDHARHPLLPHRFSQQGPGLTWFDVNKDGWDDLIVGGGRGGQLAVYQNQQGKNFERVTTAAYAAVLPRDQAGLVGLHNSAGENLLFAALSNYEDGLTNLASLVTYDFRTATVISNFSGGRDSAGPVAIADVDGDGDLDLFVGGRMRSGRFGEAASSLIFLNTGSNFVLDAKLSEPLDDIGMVSGAVFSDIDNDADPDLILACDWGPIEVFENEEGRFTKVTQQLGLAAFTGRWNGVATADVNGDGKLDIIASNWGRNTKYQSHRSQSLKLLYGDLDGNGIFDTVEAYYDDALKKWGPELNLTDLAKGLPIVRARFNSHKTFGEASLQEIFGDLLTTAETREVNYLESMLFLNRGGRFEGKLLPIEAQFAPAFAVCAADFDGDSHEDIFLSQNFFATTPETPRYDAGRGLWLRGDGNGEFRAVAGQEAGVLAYGEQRGAAAGDFDQDGRVDLAVAQNGAATKLFQNRKARVGLRVRLRGPPENPTGIGGMIRLKQSGRWGAAREVQAGSGYWSQNSAVQVFGLSEGLTHIQVRWRSGKLTETPLPAGALEISIDPAGQVEILKRR